MIPKSQNAKAVSFQPGGAFRIVNSLGPFCVLASIQFNYEAVFEAGKVNDKSSNGLLSSELVAGKLARSQPTL